jgi:L-cystine uptake protein TcyP (sodium:dicarboxylate symporter family)
MFSAYLSASTLDVLYWAISLLLFGGALYLLVRLQQEHVKFGNRVFAGLGLGVLLGLIIQFALGAQASAVKLSLSWINLVSSVYLGLLKMIVIPLVMVSVITALVKLKGQRNVGQIGASVLTILLLTTAIAALVGALTTASFGLTTNGLEKGKAEADRAATLEKSAANVAGDLPSQFASFVPANPFQDMTGARSTSTIAVVIFSGFLGFGILSVGKKRQELFDRLAGGLEALHAVVMEIVKAVLRLTPFGILALMTNIVAGSNWAQILKLANFVLLSYVAIAIMFVIHFVILAVFGLNPLTYLRKAWSTLTFAFVSRSSAATLPMTIRTQTSALGVPESISNLGSSFAVTIGQNGCAGIYPAMLAVMVAPTLGINPLAPAFLIKLIVVVAIGSLGIAGVGGGATYAGLVVLSSMGLPVWIAALLIAVEPLIDMARTSLNVSGAFVANLVTARLRGELDLQQYRDLTPDLAEESSPAEISVRLRKGLANQ